MKWGAVLFGSAILASSGSLTAQTAPNAASGFPPAAPYPYAPPPYPVFAPGIPPPGMLPLELEGSRRDLRMVLSLERDEPPFARCLGRCTLGLAPGRYTLTVGATPETPEGSREFDLERPSRLRVAPSERSSHALETTGFIMMLAGGTAIGLGFAANEPGDSSGLETTSALLLLSGLLSLGSGTVLFVIGSSIGPPTKPDFQVEPL